MIMTKQPMNTSDKNIAGGIASTLVLIVIVVAVIAGAVIYLGPDKKEGAVMTPEGEQPTEEISAEEVKALVASVGAHFLLPADEEPVVATITDATALAAEQEFYQNASNGDRLLIYQGRKQAILYNPTLDIIVNVGPVVLQDDPNAAAPAEGETAPSTNSGSSAPSTTTTETGAEATQ